MQPPNSPQGNKEHHFSSFHKGSPSVQVLQLYLSEETHDAIPPCHPLLKELINTISQKRVLDVGCGLGSVLIQGLLDYGLKPENLYSLDLDPQNFVRDEYARIHKIVGSAEQLPFESNSFDVVHSNDLTLDNDTIDFVQVLKEIARMLKKGGMYIANEHFDRVAHLRKTDAHINPHSLDFLPIINNDFLLKEIGFKPVIRVQYVISPHVQPYQFMLYLFVKQ